MYLFLHESSSTAISKHCVMQILFYFFKPLIPNETKYFNVPTTKEKKRGGE